MKHIYLIEDDAGILEGLTFLLEKTYSITGMRDARIALKKLQFELPDLILLDFFMPNLNGTTFIDALPERALKVPILVMSASNHVSAHLTYGMVAGFIRKPFQIDEMITAIQQVLEKQNCGIP